MKTIMIIRYSMTALLLFVFGCDMQSSSKNFSDSIGERNITTLGKRIIDEDISSFTGLDELAMFIAVNQSDLRVPMLEEMKQSTIKENIINMTKTLNSGNSSFARDLDSKFTERADKKVNKNLKRLLSDLSKDINIYFPVKEHRHNVLVKGESFLVAFNPPIHTGEYFVTAYDKSGNSQVVSSEQTTLENIMVIAYSENQEKYSANILPGCETGEDCGGGGSGGGNGTPITYYEGFRLKSVRTDDITDGWLDGDLELRIKVNQSDVVTSSLPFFGTISINGFTFVNTFVNHDAGSWGLFGWDDSNDWTSINAYRKWSERQSVTYLGQLYYNNTFRIFVEEEDPVFNDYIGDASFDKTTFDWSQPLYVLNGSKKCRVKLESGSYPSTAY